MAWVVWFWIGGLGSSVSYLWLGIFGLGSLTLDPFLGHVALDLWLGTFGLEDSGWYHGLESWDPKVPGGADRAADAHTSSRNRARTSK